MLVEIQTAQATPRRPQILESGMETAILITMWQSIWLNDFCVLELYGVENFQVMKEDIWSKKYELQCWLGDGFSFWLLEKGRKKPHKDGC
jgi:hypothetical protein